MNFPKLQNVPSVSIIIPAYNEARTLGNVIARVLDEVPYLLEIIIVDDRSTDQTHEIARSISACNRQVKVVCHSENLGKSAALRSGFSHSTGDIVVVQDADYEYDPANIANIVRPILEGRADVVYGSRFMARHAPRSGYWHHHLANRLLTTASNLMTGLKITDVETGYKAFRGEIIRDVEIASSGFGFEIEITAKLAQHGHKIYEVPVSYTGRTYAEGKKIGFADGLAAVWFLLYFNIFHRRQARRERPTAAPCPAQRLFDPVDDAFEGLALGSRVPAAVD